MLLKSKMLDLPVDFKVKAVGEDDDVIQIEGYANTTTVDRVGDIVLAEAWTKGGLDNYLKNPIILAYHDHKKPIGKMVEYYVNDKGLKIVAHISKAAGDIYNLIKSGILSTFSVGFRTKDADYDVETDLFVIKDLELMEISVVSVPANADSVFSVKKSFDSDDEYAQFKSEFLNGNGEVNTDPNRNKEIDNDEEISNMTKEEMEAELREKIKKELEEEARRKAEIEALVEDKVKSVEEVVKTSTVEVVGTRVEELKSDLEKKMADENTSLAETIGELKSQVEQYAEELQALHKSKMTFTNKGGREDAISEQEKDIAVLVSKITDTPVEETKYGKAIIEKASDGAHQTGMTNDWETGFSTRLFNDVRERLIVEPLFTSFDMPMATMNIPLNPEAGYGTWVTSAEFNAASSSGAAQIHGINDTQITAYKLATKELLSYEEEDDSLIALVPIIREAAVRRMARSSDKALLIGDVGVSAGTNEGVYPFNGLATIGIDDGRTTVIGGTLASPTKVTIADLQAMRRSMGVHGHNPNDIVYVVSHTVYFDLLDDPDFRTMDKVGPNATILTGQIGQAAGSPVIVSGEFQAAAANTPAGICVNMSNYLKGNYKSLMVERERSVEKQQNLLVVTRRFGMIELFPANPTVATLVNPSA